jgi:hypothetical protein
MDDVPAAPAPKNPVVEPTPDQPFDPYERFKS